MKWRNLLHLPFRREPGPVKFPLHVDLGNPRVRVTIHSHELATAAGPISCWSYVTSGLAFWGQKEIVLTLKRESHEAPAGYPKEPLDYLGAIAPYAREGRLVDAGDVTPFGPRGGIWGGHVMYVPVQPLAGVEIPPGSLAAILITAHELDTLRSHGATRVMARLGREAAYFPCPPWADRTRLRSARPISRESILNRVPDVSLPGVSVTYDGRNVRISAADGNREALRGAMTGWSPDQPLAILTGLGMCDGCLVWEPGMTGVNAITPPNSHATHLAACFVIIAGGQPSNEIRVVEDGIGLTLTAEATASLRDALIHGRELRLFTADGAAIVADSPDNAPPSSIVMLYPESEWGARGVDPLMLSLYIKDLSQEIHRVPLGNEPLNACDVFVALRGRSSRIWNVPPALRERLEQIRPPAVEPGPFAFVVRAGHDRQPFDGSLDFPIEWQAAGGERPASDPPGEVTLDDVIAHAWPSRANAGSLPS